MTSHVSPVDLSPPASAGRAPWRKYSPLPKVYDELAGADGTFRPHWRKLIAGLEALERHDELGRRWDQAQRLIRENGITYNVYADPQGMDRPWQLDAIPLMIGAAEWRDLEAGLIQRARLLNAIMADLYGPQSLLRDGLLPAALVFGNPHFLRPCHGIRPAGDTYLHFYAVDLGRAPDGRWWVLSDRTQAPSGAGYALENRIILSRSLPELFRDCQVQRLASFFQAVRDGLLGLARRDEPRIVLLTPGPLNEAYFEHAYLARYLGYPLVEGGDLTVRDNRVYLKTLDGLKPVDVILRRLDGDFCDPLELRGDSTLGIAGLVQAAKAGNVVVANALGSGLLECEALMAFLPGLCRHLLGETLRIPCIATWWCGQDDARRYVLDHLDNLAIRPTFETRSILSPPQKPILGADLSAAERTALAEKLKLRGYNFIGQELVGLSTMPVWNGGNVRPAPMALRVYLAAAGDGYVVMPGGLTRVSASNDTRAVSMQRGDGSKDTWVLSDRPVTGFSLLRQFDHSVHLRRGGKDLSSRSADNLYWLGRYAERAEGTMRLLRSLLVRLTEYAGPASDSATLDRLLSVMVRQGKVAPPAAQEAAAGQTGALERELRTLLYDPDYPPGLPRILADLHRIAMVVRDRLSLDAWRTLNLIHPDMLTGGTAADLEVGEALHLVNDGIRTLAAFSGLEMENMTRSHGWRFLDMGRRIERALHMLELLRALTLAGDPQADGSLELLLELADSFMTYRSRYLTTPQLAPVLDLLLADETNPRSVGFQIAALESHANELPRNLEPTMLSAEQRLIIATRNKLRLAEIAQLCEADAWRRRSELDDLLTCLSDALPELSDLFARSYFSHAEPSGPPALPRRGGAL